MLKIGNEELVDEDEGGGHPSHSGVEEESLDQVTERRVKPLVVESVTEGDEGMVIDCRGCCVGNDKASED